jgi:hypothetical protein
VHEALNGRIGSSEPVVLSGPVVIKEMTMDFGDDGIVARTVVEPVRARASDPVSMPGPRRGSRVGDAIAMALKCFRGAR